MLIMVGMENQYISLEVLAARLGLPRPFLRKQATSGGIPCLSVNGRLRFEESAVRDALRQQAAEQKSQASDDHEVPA